jgi:hypothetical protein
MSAEEAAIGAAEGAKSNSRKAEPSGPAARATLQHQRSLPTPDVDAGEAPQAGGVKDGWLWLGSAHSHSAGTPQPSACSATRRISRRAGACPPRACRGRPGRGCGGWRRRRSRRRRCSCAGRSGCRGVDPLVDLGNQPRPALRAPLAGRLRGQRARVGLGRLTLAPDPGSRTRRRTNKLLQSTD